MLHTIDYQLMREEWFSKVATRSQRFYKVSVEFIKDQKFKNLSYERSDGNTHENCGLEMFIFEAGFVCLQSSDI